MLLLILNICKFQTYKEKLVWPSVEEEKITLQMISRDHKTEVLLFCLFRSGFRNMLRQKGNSCWVTFFFYIKQMTFVCSSCLSASREVFLDRAHRNTDVIVLQQLLWIYRHLYLSIYSSQHNCSLVSLLLQGICFYFFVCFGFGWLVGLSYLKNLKPLMSSSELGESLRFMPKTITVNMVQDADK